MSIKVSDFDIHYSRLIRTKNDFFGRVMDLNKKGSLVQGNSRAGGLRPALEDILFGDRVQKRSKEAFLKIKIIRERGALLDSVH